MAGNPQGNKRRCKHCNALAGVDFYCKNCRGRGFPPDKLPIDPYRKQFQNRESIVERSKYVQEGPSYFYQTKYYQEDTFPITRSEHE